MTDLFPVALEKLTKTYRSGRTALAGASFRIRGGEVVGLLGENGAGKSTLIKILATVQKPTSGTLRFGPGGADIWAASEDVRLRYKRGIGWVPEHAILYDRLTAREHLQFVGRLLNVDSAVLGPRISSLLSRCQLDPNSRQWLGTYSNGMRRKTTLAAALLGDPAFLILDEPTSSLDPQGVRLIKDLIRAWRAEGKAVLLSTHVLDIAQQLCDRLVVLHRGEQIFEGTVDELKKEQSGPSNPSLEELFLALVHEGGPGANEGGSGEPNS